MFLKENSHQTKGILFFIKYPEQGKVKSRLATDLGALTSTKLYRCFLLDSLTTLYKLQLPILLCYTPANALNKFQQWLGNDSSYMLQKGRTLGQRMKQCFHDAFSQGFEQLILLGSDSPDIPLTYLREAFSSLQSHEVVLGPSIDGGYYLIGFRKTGFSPLTFDDIPWSTSSVFSTTLTKLRKEGKVVHQLPTWYDIDTMSDLKQFYLRNKKMNEQASRTMMLLYNDDALVKKLQVEY